MTSERLAVSLEDGELYMFWNLKPSSWSFEHEIESLLRECEDNINEHNREIEKEEHRKAGITAEQELEELYAQITNERKRIDKEKELKGE